MSLKNKFFSFLAVAFGVVALSTFTLAQESTTTAPATEKSGQHMKGEGRGWGHDKDGHGRHGGRGMMGMLRGIDLTEAQKTQIHSIMEANKPDKATMEEMQVLRKAKHDGTITAAQQERMTALKTQGMDKAKSVHEQIKAILTPDQIAKIEQRKVERKQRMEERKMRHQQDPAGTTEKPVN
jgi:Spy/CpxP family protein refolding chaperone